MTRRVGNRNSIPHVSITRHELMVLKNVVGGFLDYLRGGVLPSAERKAQIQILEGLYVRLVRASHAWH